MVYRGERAYPGRISRTKAKKKAAVSAKTVRVCITLVVATVMLTTLCVKYSRLYSSTRRIEESEAYNTALTEKLEYYTTEIERLTSFEMISERAVEMGLIQKPSARNIEIPSHG